MNDTLPMFLYKMDSGQTVSSVSLFKVIFDTSWSLFLHYFVQIARPNSHGYHHCGACAQDGEATAGIF